MVEAVEQRIFPIEAKRALLHIPDPVHAAPVLQLDRHPVAVFPVGLIAIDIALDFVHDREPGGDLAPFFKGDVGGVAQPLAQALAHCRQRRKQRQCGHYVGELSHPAGVNGADRDTIPTSQ